MKKVSLLALVGLMTMGTAFAEDIYIIKDGQLVDGYKAVPQDGEEVIEFGASATDGSTAAAFYHNVQWKDFMIDLSANRVDMTKAWYLTIEYMAGEQVMKEVLDDQGKVSAKSGDVYSELYNGKNPMFHIGFFAYGVPHSGLDINKADARVRIDGKSHKTANEWLKDSRLVYANAKSLAMDTLLIGCIREVATDPDDPFAPVYIKNLYLSPWGDQCSRPFYTENFSGNVNGWEDGDLNKSTASQMIGGYAISTSKTSAIRRWQDGGYGTDGAVTGYYDDEMLHALIVDNADTASVIAGIELPNNHNGKIIVNALFAFRWVDGTTFYEETTPAADKKIGASITFDNGETVKIFDQEIPAEWTEIEEEVNVPDGAKSFTISFKQDKFNFLVDNLQIGTCAAGLEVEEAANESAVIYATNDLVVVEGVEYTDIEVLNLNGVVVANANISGLNAGAYIAKVYTANGVISQTIIKK
ncbi:MAG: T9SS type A sorting domain-containing protein [Paludibacteraceae bacterium]|nr:T9SS type A sorting domain-containing protein [Paludibacteraceae bacterium]